MHISRANRPAAATAESRQLSLSSLAQPRGIDLGLSAGTQQGIFGHQPLSLAHLVAGSITAHLAIGGVREGAIMLGARLAIRAPVAGLPALLAAQFDVGAGGLEGLITLDASHVMPRQVGPQ